MMTLALPQRPDDSRAPGCKREALLLVLQLSLPTSAAPRFSPAVRSQLGPSQGPASTPGVQADP